MGSYGSPEASQACSPLPVGEEDRAGVSVREADINLLWQRARARDADARADLIERYRPYVAQIVRRMGLPATAVVDRDDLVSAGVVGLIDAIDRFDPGRNVPFEAYAATRIRGAVLDEIRQLDLYGRAVWRHARELRAASDTITARTGRAPSLAELTAATALDGERLRVALQARAEATVSLDRLVADNGEGAWGPSEDPSLPILERDLRDDVRRALEALPAREHHVLRQIYDESLTLRQVGVQLGVSEARVCQLHARAISQLRRFLFHRSGAVPAPAA